MKPARIDESEAGWGRKLDYLPAPAAIMVGGILGMAAGIAAALMAAWPGTMVSVGAIALAVGLAMRARAIIMLVGSKESVGVRRIEPTAMANLDGGVFGMGSPESFGTAHSREKPVHSVAVSPFSCMKYPVTRELWLEVMGSPQGWWPDGPSDSRPINNVTWYEAIRFCNALSEREGLIPCYGIGEQEEVEWISYDGYRLPTEAEWEYACRAGKQTLWYFGNDRAELKYCAWYEDNSRNQPQPVGKKEPNTWGLHDMHGNVWEWCWDWYSPYPDPPPEAPLLNPRGPDKADPLSGKARVVRGGSFAEWANDLRCADRGWFDPGKRDLRIGFRCVRGGIRQMEVPVVSSPVD